MEFIATKDSYTDGRYYSANQIYNFPGDPPNPHFRPGDVEEVEQVQAKPAKGAGRPRHDDKK